MICCILKTTITTTRETAYFWPFSCSLSIPFGIILNSLQKPTVMFYKVFRWIKSKFSSKKNKGGFDSDNPFLILWCYYLSFTMTFNEADPVRNQAPFDWLLPTQITFYYLVLNRGISDLTGAALARNNLIWQDHLSRDQYTPCCNTYFFPKKNHPMLFFFNWLW